MQAKTFTSEVEIEKAVLVAVEGQGQSEEQTREYLDELEFLATTAGADTIKTFIQRMDTPNPTTYVGSGKLETIKSFVREHDVDMAIFDDELSASQIRNLERELKCKIIDRSALILDIFAKNAKTARARTQVELAQSEYLLPRLTKLWTHLEKQRGGIGMKGPGEKEIETDRRVIRDKISRLKKKLKDIDVQSHTQRKNRTGKFSVALVGYTNVGKSTIMNLLSKADVLAENKLFATLDSTVRKVAITSQKHFDQLPKIILLSDTVGFIRKLPHQLIESFKSTLDEVIDADLLLHVVDISHSAFMDQIDVVNETLDSIGAGSKPTIMIYNKIDKFNPEPTSEDIFEDESVYSIDELKRMWMAKGDKPMAFISAINNEGIEELRELIFEQVK